MQKKVKVEKGFNGLRLDLFLALNFNEFTRSFIKKQIENENVKVNEKVEYRANYRVREGDDINFGYEKAPQNNSVKPQKISLEIIYEDEDLVLINKPAGMVVHPATGHQKDTLVNALLYKYKGIAEVGKRIRAGLINRIDRDTSGIVFVGKTNRALWFYSRQFAQRQVKKEYLAVVSGDFSKVFQGKQNIEVRNYLGRNPKKRKKFSVVDSKKGKLAITDFEFVDLSEDNQYSLVIARPKTGRTHQIRVHLSFLGHPILGDLIYSKERAERLLLHSYSAELELLGGNQLKITSSLDKPFSNFIKQNFNDTRAISYIKPQKQDKKKKGKTKSN